MRKLFTIFLALFLVLSLSGAVFAAEGDADSDVTTEPESTTKEQQTTTIEYSADVTTAKWEVTVPQTLKPLQEGDVEASGIWSPFKNLSVTVQSPVNMYLLGDDGIQTEDFLTVNVDFNPINLTGGYGGEVSASSKVTVDKEGAMSHIQFGKWQGTMTFDIELKPNQNYQGGAISETVVTFANVVDGTYDVMTYTSSDKYTADSFKSAGIEDVTITQGQPSPSLELLVGTYALKDVNNTYWTFKVTKTGTEEVSISNVIIQTAKGLAQFRDVVNAGDTYAGKTVYLATNISLADVGWTSIANFAGTFDGQGHTISNLKDATLFGTVSGEVKNLNLQGVTRTVTDYTNKGTAAFIGTVATGGIVDGCKVSDVTLTWADTVTDCGDGVSGVIGSVNDGATVQNCEFSNVEITAQGKLKKTGGIFGVISGDVSGCTVNDVSIITTGEKGFTQEAGGFVRQVSATAHIFDCTINDVTITTEYVALKTGGFAGITYGGVITNCDMNNVVMSVDKTYSEFGGFIGQHDSRSNDARLTVTDCDITGLDMTVKGYYQDWSCSSAGFISGVSGGADITSCSIAGDITANEATVTVGGFVGSAGSSQNYVVNISDCVADIDITVGDNAGGAFVGRVGGCMGTGDTWNVTFNFVNCEATGTVTATGDGTAGEFYGEKIVTTCTFTGCTVNGAAFTA